VAKINTGRVIQGGLIAGLVINIVSIVNNVGIVGRPAFRSSRPG